MSGRLVLITGGSRSGKSRQGLALARHHPAVLVLGPGVAADDEMRSRIAAHKRERPSHWRTLESRFDLAAALERDWQGEACLLLDDLATVTSNLLVERDADEQQVLDEVAGLLAFSARRRLELLVVSAEVGLGLVPTSSLGRRYRDLLGLANQAVAAAADEVLLMVAGLPLRVKG